MSTLHQGMEKCYPEHASQPMIGSALQCLFPLYWEHMVRLSWPSMVLWSEQLRRADPHSHARDSLGVWVSFPSFT